MSQRNRFWPRRVAAVLLALVVVGGIAFLFNENSLATSPWQLLTRQARGVPPASRATGSSRGGGGRGPVCVLAEADVDGELRSVVALMPVFEADASNGVSVDDSEALRPVDRVERADSPVYVGGYTVEQQPTFWFYVPYVANSELDQPTPQSPDASPQAIADTDNIRVGKFVLLDENRQFVSSHLMAIELLQTPRLVGFQLPFSLELGQLYNWYFSVVCEPEKPSRNPVVRGWVQRVESSPTLKSALRNAQPFQRYLAYAEDDIWFESFSELVATRRQFPTLPEAQQIWYELLTSFNILRPETIDLGATDPVAVREGVGVSSPKENRNPA
jgi:Domain of Unknown Function (DUF928)